MKKNRGLKAALIIAAICILSGGVLIGAGFMKGGTIDQMYIGRDNTNWWPFSFNLGIYSRFDEEMENKFEESWSVDLQDVKDIELSMDIGDVVIQKGEKAKLSIHNIKRNYVKIEEKNKKTEIKVKHSNKLMDGINATAEESIVLTLPSDAYEVAIDSDVGNIRVQDLMFHKLDIENSLGNVVLKDIITYQLSVEEQAGDIQADGKFYNKTEIENDLGNIDLKVNGKKSEYNVKASCSLGNLNVDGESHMGNGDVRYDNQQKNSIIVDNSLGNVTISFR